MRPAKNCISTVIRSELCVPAPAEGLNWGSGQRTCSSTPPFPAEHSMGKVSLWCQKKKCTILKSDGRNAYEEANQAARWSLRMTWHCQCNKAAIAFTPWTSVTMYAPKAEWQRWAPFTIREETETQPNTLFLCFFQGYKLWVLSVQNSKKKIQEEPSIFTRLVVRHKQTWFISISYHAGPIQLVNYTKSKWTVCRLWVKRRVYWTCGESHFRPSS